MSRLILGPLRWLQRRVGWSWVVLLVCRDDDGVAMLQLPADLPVSVRHNTDATVSVTIGHGDDGDALLAELHSLVG
jgi:hypothetical protein